MVEQRERSLILLARIQAVINALLAVGIFAFYQLKPGLLTDGAASGTMAIFGAAGAVYFLTLHQVIGRRRLALSTLILTLVTITNLIMLIAATGGLDSPYYALWLLAIVAAGIFGLIEAVVIVVMTLIYYAIDVLHNGFGSPFFADHIIQLILTLTAAGLAEWVHYRSRRSASATSKIESLSGKLSAEQLKAQALMASIGEGVMVVDTTRRVQLFNKAAQTLTGWDEASATGIDYNAILQLRTIDDKQLGPINDPFAQAWTQGTSVVRDDLCMMTRSGRKSQLSLSISPLLDESGSPTGAIALFRDISHEKEVERQKDEFVSTASHEMRTPVAAIEGYIALAMNSNVATIDDRAKKYLDKAHETIQHLGELFRDLLSVTKADEGALGGKIEPINVPKLLEGAVGDMQFAAQKKNLTLVLQTSNTTGKALSPLYHVAANPERLREVVMNLIDNAIKYTPEGGIKVVMAGDDKEVRVSIVDTGPGIAAEDQPHLFQKFYRIDNTDTRTIGGTGLGLYLCRRLIEAFNGRIWVESQLKKGSSFNFSLPRLKEEDVRRLQAAATNPLVTGPTPVSPLATPAAYTPVTAAPAPPAAAGPAIVKPIPMPVPSQHVDISQSRRIS